jgi:hypothetical protein
MNLMGIPNTRVFLSTNCRLTPIQMALFALDPLGKLTRMPRAPIVLRMNARVLDLAAKVPCSTQRLSSRYTS